MKQVLKGSEAESYILQEGYGEVHKDVIERLFSLEDLVDGWGDKVTKSNYYPFLVNTMSGDAFLEDIYSCQEDIELGIDHMAAFGITDLTIKVDGDGKIYIVD